MKAIVTATIEDLKSIGIGVDGLVDDDFGPGVTVTVIIQSVYHDLQFGEIVEVEYLYKGLNYCIPLKWLKITDNDSN